MKTAALSLLLFSMAANAQPLSHDEMVAQLNQVLLPLKSVADLPQAQAEIATRFVSDLARHYVDGFAVQGLGKPLARVLAGKDLSDDTLTPLTEAILGVIDSTRAWRGDGSRGLRTSPELRASLEQAYSALTALHVSSRDTRLVIILLCNVADRLTQSVLKPISPT